MDNLIFERLGVPDGILRVANDIYDSLISEISSEITPTKSKYFFVFSSNPPYTINDFVIDRVVLEVNIVRIREIDNIEFMGMDVRGSLGQNFQGNTPKFYNEDKEGVSKMLFNIATPTDGWDSSDLNQYLINDKARIVSSFAHELKHEYDEYKQKHINIDTRLDYMSARDAMGTIEPIGEFAFMLYYTSIIESLVRPTEIAAELGVLGITKKEFLEFLLNNRTYRQLKEIQKFTLYDLKRNLHNYLPEIEDVFNHLELDYSEMTDNEKVDEILRLFVFNFSDKKFQTYVRFLTETMSEDIFGLQGKKLKWAEDFITKLSKDVSNPEKFFIGVEKMFKHTSTKMIKKISKLYDYISSEKNS